MSCSPEPERPRITGDGVPTSDRGNSPSAIGCYPGFMRSCGKAAKPGDTPTFSLGYADQLPPFYRGDAYEGLARAAMVLGDQTTRQTALQAAKAWLSEVAIHEECELLKADLRSLE